MVSDEEHERRVKSMEKLAEELEELEGVEEAILDDYAPDTACSGQIAVIVESSDVYKEGLRSGAVYTLEADLRSLAQRMRAVLKSSDVVNTSVYEKPESVYNVADDPIGHDSDMYMMEVVP